MASVAYPDGNSATYSYTNGAVSGVTFTASGTTASAASAITYRPGGAAMASWTASNGLVNTLAYDSDGRLTGISVPTIQSLAFTYDNANRISAITNTISSTLTQTFGYDASSRLGTVASTADNESYSYDANSNRITQVVNGTSTLGTVSATSNQLASFGATAYGYDTKGNTTTVAGTTTYQYDAFNRMVSAGGMTYYVNPEGQRLRKSGSLGTSYFAPDRSGAMLAEYSGGAWVDYVWLNGRLIGRVAGAQRYAIHDDQTGRPEAVTDGSQAVVWRAQNFAFTQNVTTASITLNLGFPGQYYDTETGSWNNGFRDYKAGLGRYLESDPIGLAGGVNTYAYVGDNPITGFDTFGLQDESVNKQQAENGVQGVVNEAGAVLIPDRAGAISDIGGSLAGGAVAMGSVYHSLAQQDYSDYTAPEGGIHDYPKLFGDMDWSQYPTFADAWKAYLQKRMGKKCP